MGDKEFILYKKGLELVTEDKYHPRWQRSGPSWEEKRIKRNKLGESSPESLYYYLLLMTQLKEEEEGTPSVVYHMTSVENLREIIEEGQIDPSKNRRGTGKIDFQAGFFRPFREPLGGYGVSIGIRSEAIGIKRSSSVGIYSTSKEVPVDKFDYIFIFYSSHGTAIKITAERDLTVASKSLQTKVLNLPTRDEAEKIREEIIRELKEKYGKEVAIYLVDYDSMMRVADKIFIGRESKW